MSCPRRVALLGSLLTVGACVNGEKVSAIEGESMDASAGAGGSASSPSSADASVEAGAEAGGESDANGETAGSATTGAGSAATTAAPSSSATAEPETTTDTEPGELPPENGLYTDLVDTVIVEVDYAEGAEPETDEVVGFGDPWDVLENNLEALFADNPKALLIDRTLEQMQDIGPMEDEDFTASRLREIAGEFRDDLTTETTRTYYIVYVGGYYANGEGRRPGVLGVSVGNGVIGMFKPVLRNSGGFTIALTGQAVLVHELGHAAGLVNTGVPLTSDHQDVEHGKHCTNRECVMYWTVNGSDAAVEFVVNNLTSPEAVLWGDECLDDIYAADE